LTTIDLSINPIPHDNLAHLARPNASRDCRSYSPPHPPCPQATRPRIRERSYHGNHRPVRRRPRRTRSPLPAHHLASHVDPHQSWLSGCREAGPVALVSPQRKSSSPSGEEPAHPTVMESQSVLSSPAKRGTLVFASGGKMDGLRQKP